MSNWDGFLSNEFKKDYFIKLNSFLDNEYTTNIVYPKKEEVFNAFNFTDYKDIKVVILGQDPYHKPNQAHGLSFSVKNGVKLPPSLKNIFKELSDDLGISNTCGDLSSWAKQGVFLLNTTLTVRQNEPLSHHNQGWEKFTDETIKFINEKSTPVVFILWGANAISKKKFITSGIHHILESAHPSPLSSYRGFFESKVFSKCNDYLINDGLSPIDWKVSCE